MDYFLNSSTINGFRINYRVLSLFLILYNIQYSTIPWYLYALSIPSIMWHFQVVGGTGFKDIFQINGDKESKNIISSIYLTIFKNRIFSK